jgi:hypothetical protein
MNHGDYYVVAVGRAVLESVYPLSLVRAPVTADGYARVKRYDTGSAAQRDVLKLAEIGVYGTVEYVGSVH